VTCRVHHPDAPGLDDLVVDPGRFVADSLFQQPCWSPAAERALDVERLATVEGLWADALQRHVRAPGFRLVRDGATLARATYCRSAGVGHQTIGDLIEPNRALELHRAGATMVLQGLQLTDPALARFTTNLALALDHPVQINAYLSPAEARGLELHFDFHDVFVIQLAGAKRWRVWEPLDHTREPVRGISPAFVPPIDELGAPLLDLTLQQRGDCLYLPRGFPHAAETVESSSAHLTVGIMAVTWQHVVRQATRAAVAAGHLRASVPARSLDGAPAGRSGMPDLSALGDALEPTQLRAWMATEVWRRLPATRLRPLAPPVVDLARPVVVTPGPLLWACPSSASDGRIQLGLGDRRLDLPAEALPLLAALLGAPDGFVAADWAGPLDQCSQQVVMDRLAAEGVIVHRAF